MADGDVRFRDLLLLAGDLDLVEDLLRDVTAAQEQNAALLALAVSVLTSSRATCLFMTVPMPLEEQQAARAYVEEATRPRRLTDIARRLLVVRALAVARSRARRLFPAVLLAAATSAVVVYVASGGSVVPGSRSFVRFSVLMLRFLFGAI